MRILYFYPEQENDFMFYWQRIHFVNELEEHGLKIDILNPLKYESLAASYDALLETIGKVKYDLFFMSAPRYINKEMLEIIRKKGIPSLCFRPDNLLIPYIDKDIANYFDLVWLTARETENLYKKWGVNYFFAPYAANPMTFFPIDCQQKHKMCFVGTPYGSRSNLINNIVSNNIELDVFCKNNPNLSSGDFKPGFQMPELSTHTLLIKNLMFKTGRKLIYSNVLNKFQTHELDEDATSLHLLPKVPFDELNRIYSSYALSLASTSARNTDILREPVGVVNLRAFEIPMAGGLQFCRYNEELAGYFEEDKEIVFYRDNVDLIEKANYYTKRASDAEIAKIKKAARIRAEGEHTWWHRFVKAFDILGIKYD